MVYEIFHGFGDNPLHAVPQALAIASELAISLRRWSNIDNWHAECDTCTCNDVIMIHTGQNGELLNIQLNLTERNIYQLKTHIR